MFHNEYTFPRIPRQRAKRRGRMRRSLVSGHGLAGSIRWFCANDSYIELITVRR